MTSEVGSKYAEAYVWVWLPTATEPVVAGLLSQQGQQLVFNYGRSYLARDNAIALTEQVPAFAWPQLPIFLLSFTLFAMLHSC
jgi:hypothetical protein